MDSLKLYRFLYLEVDKCFNGYQVDKIKQKNKIKIPVKHKITNQR